MKYCKNCGNPIHDKYCGHCGQKGVSERITLAFISHEIFHFFSHIENGFLFTSLQMVKVPGNTVKNFIGGARKKYQPPVSYFLIWITIFILFLYSLEKIFGDNIVINYQEYFGPSATTRFAIRHLSLVLTIVIPFQALYLYLLVKKKNINYFESIVAILYAMGTIILFQFVFAVLALVIHSTTGISVDLQYSDAFKILYLAWFIYDTIQRYTVTYKILKTLLFLVLAFGTFTLWRIYGFPAFIKIFSSL